MASITSADLLNGQFVDMVALRAAVLQLLSNSPQKMNEWALYVL